MRRSHLLIALFVLSLAAHGQDRLASAYIQRHPLSIEAPAQLHGPVSEPVFMDGRLFANWWDVARGKVSCREAWTLNYGLSHDASDHVDFLMLSYHRVYPYQDVWVHQAPEALMFKFEFSVGSRIRMEPRAVASCGIFAMYYLSDHKTRGWRPYVEAGIGAIYTDFQRHGQGLRWNFNPRAGFGVEIPTKRGSRYILALRAHHVSNGELDDANRGINSAFIMFGRYF